MYKNSKGITLIALVITIIVLVILAGVTISLVIRDSGIIEKAKLAKNSMELAQKEENQLLQNAQKRINELLSSNSQEETNLPPIPSGYYEVGGTKEEGFVISDKENDDMQNSKGGNQFVWIPVEYSNSEFDSKFIRQESTLYINNISISQCLEPSVVEVDKTNIANFGFDSSVNSIEQVEIKLQQEYNEMINSVKKNKGFYIGRYETGNLNLKYGSKVVSVKDADDMNNTDWYTAYRNAKTLSTTDTKTSLLWGVQWDAMLEFLNDYQTDKTKIHNSSSWGNFLDNTEKGHGVIQKTGSNENWQMKHIYDVLGNVFEWTIEGTKNSGRVYRGGCYANKKENASASTRVALLSQNSAHEQVGARIWLCF